MAAYITAPVGDDMTWGIVVVRQDVKSLLIVQLSATHLGYLVY